MEPPADLATTFRTNARVQVVVPGAPAELGQLLRRAFDTARAQWPDVSISAEQFVGHLAERLPRSSEGKALEQVLGQLHLGDLYLAFACAAGVPEGITAFDQHYLAKLPTRLGAAKVPVGRIDDVCQLVREKLLVRGEQGTSHLATYAGEGELQNFVYVIGLRMAGKLRGADKPAPEQDVDAALEALPAPGADAELDLIKRNLHGQLRSAVRAACSVLSAEDRHLLKLHYVKGLSTSKLGGLFGVDQATAWRRLERVRKTIKEETKRALQERLRLSNRDFESMLAVLESRLDMSLSQIFGGDDEDDEDDETE